MGWEGWITMKILMWMAAGVMTVLGTAGCTDCGYYRFAESGDEGSAKRRFGRDTWGGDVRNHLYRWER